jgi:hypothetical protein
VKMSNYFEKITNCNNETWYRCYINFEKKVLREKEITNESIGDLILYARTYEECNIDEIEKFTVGIFERVNYISSITWTKWEVSGSISFSSYKKSAGYRVDIPTNLIIDTVESFLGKTKEIAKSSVVEKETCSECKGTGILDFEFYTRKCSCVL